MRLLSILLCLALLGCGCGVKLATELVPTAAPRAGLLEQAQAMRAINEWVESGDGRQARVDFVWDKTASACKVTLTEGERIVTGQGAELPSAAKEALERWKE